MQKIEAIDLFCGIGGLSYGLKCAGIDIKAGLDNDSFCKYAYEQNIGASFIEEDIAQFDFKTLKDFYSEGSTRVLVGCAPCQPFSPHTQKSKNKEFDKRWNLLACFTKAVEIIKPHVISMENVPGLVKTDVFSTFERTLKNLGYETSYEVVNCSEYGLPQHRKRLVFLASKFGTAKLTEPNNITKKTRRTVRDAIGSLDPIKDGKHSPLDCLHKSSKLSELNLKRIKASKPGGTWHDWPKELVADCHKKTSGEKFIRVYSRMEWDKPSPTITTQFVGFSHGRFGHPEQNRALSLREGAILQGFPKEYKFTKEGEEPKNTIIGRLIGNAVPVDLGRVIGESIIKHLEEVAK